MTKEEKIKSLLSGIDDMIEVISSRADDGRVVDRITLNYWANLLRFAKKRIGEQDA